jgi:hypothetical protein
MITLAWEKPNSIEDVQALVQRAINLEFSTLPPYLYALMSIPPGENAAARARIHAIAMQEMIHMSLACNIMNAIGGSPDIVAPLYPGGGGGGGHRRTGGWEGSGGGVRPAP